MKTQQPEGSAPFLPAHEVERFPDGVAFAFRDGEFHYRVLISAQVILQVPQFGGGPALVPGVVPTPEAIPEQLGDPVRRQRVQADRLVRAVSQLVQEVLGVVEHGPVFAADVEELIHGHGEGGVGRVQPELRSAGDVPVASHVGVREFEMPRFDVARFVADHAL